MRRLTLGAAMAASLALAACNDNDSTAPDTDATDYALVYFGTAGSALENTMGPQGGRPFDGRTGVPRFPEGLELTDEQKAAMTALREAFRAEHLSELAALRAICEEARAARESGASREEIRAILEEGRAIAQGLRADVAELHAALLALLTDEQREWLESRRPPLPRDLDGRQQRHHRPPGGGPRR